MKITGENMGRYKIYMKVKLCLQTITYGTELTIKTKTWQIDQKCFKLTVTVC